MAPRTPEQIEARIADLRREAANDTDPFRVYAAGLAVHVLRLEHEDSMRCQAREVRQ